MSANGARSPPAVGFDVHGLVQRCAALVSSSPRPREAEVGYTLERGLPEWRQGRGDILGAALAHLWLAAAGCPEVTATHLHVAAGEADPDRLHFALTCQGPWPASPRPAEALDGPWSLALAVSDLLLQGLGSRLVEYAATSDRPWLEFDAALPAIRRHAPDDSAAAPRWRVLLVEDHQRNAEMTTEMLQAHGDVEVVVAGSGASALSNALQHDFDLVLMDMFLPDTDGVVVARKIHRMLGAKAPPVIALTANAYASDRDLCLAAGMVDFLSKPVDGATLRRALLEWGPWFRSHRDGGVGDT